MKNRLNGVERRRRTVNEQQQQQKKNKKRIEIFLSEISYYDRESFVGMEIELVIKIVNLLT